MDNRNVRIDYHFRPGRSLSEGRLRNLIFELRQVGRSCFDPLPAYQCLIGTREELADKVITVARTASGRALAFSSAVILPVPGFGPVLHLGLTCVRPEARSGRLTSRLLSRLLLSYWLRQRGRRFWISNVACVLSSLGNVALTFDDIYPSPFGPAHPSADHLAIARGIDRHFRSKMHIDASAQLDERRFVFRASVPGSVFQKQADDARFRHRDLRLNHWYASLMDFSAGDEVLQVGWIGAPTLLRHLGRQKRRFRSPLPEHSGYALGG